MNFAYIWKTLIHIAYNVGGVRKTNIDQPDMVLNK